MVAIARKMAKKERMVRNTYSIKESVDKMLDSYIEYAIEQGNLGETLSKQEVVASLTEVAMDDDRGFQKWLKERETKPRVNPRPKADKAVSTTQAESGSGFSYSGQSNLA